MIRGRLAVIDDERNLILGQDLGGTLTKGMVYEIVGDEFGLGEDITLRCIGEYALPEKGFPSKYSTVGTQVSAGLHLITKEEKEKLC